MSRSILIALSVSVVLLLLITVGARRFGNHPDQMETIMTGPITAAVAQAMQTGSPLPSPRPQVSEQMLDQVPDQDSVPTIHLRQPTTETLISNRATLYLVFDQPMDQVSVVKALTVTPTVDLKTSWTNDTLYIAPIASFTPATVYTFTLDTSATSMAGQPLDQRYTWHHRTPVRLEGGPVVDSTRLDSPIIMRFSHPVTTTDVTLVPRAPITWTWNNLGTELTLTPQPALHPYTTYQITFPDPVYDETGQAVEIPQRLEFSTPASIRGYTSGSTIAPVTPLSIDFTPPIDRAATAATLQLTPTITGTIGWIGETLRFTPTQGYFAPNTNYLIQVTPTFSTALNEIVAAAPISWTFATTGLTNWANFGSGTKIQGIHSGNPRTIQYQRATRHGSNTPPLTFALYQLDDEQLMQAFHDVTTGQKWAESNGASSHINVADLPEVARWQVPTPAQLYGEMSMGIIVYTTTVPTTVPSGTVPPGPYLLSLEAGYVNDQLLVLLTSEMVMAKQADEQLMVWVSGIDGIADEAIPVEVYDDAGLQIGQGKTDAEGRFMLQGEAANNAQLVVAHTEEGPSAVGITPAWRNRGNSWFHRQSTPLRRYTSYLYTDRPIYRPGQTVYFKAIVREDADALLTTPPVDTPVTIRVRDARDNIVRTYTLTTNEMGTVNGAFTVADGAMLGSYALEIEMPDEVADGMPDKITGERKSQRQPFMVEEYHKPDYQVAVTVSPPNPKVGDLITITVQSDYFMGLPVAHGKVTLRQYRLYDETYANASPTHWVNPFDNKSGQLDANGRWQTTLHLGGDNPAPYHRMNRRRWAIEATVHDAARQRAANYVLIESAQGAPKAQPLTLDLGTEPKVPDEPFLINVQANQVSAPRLEAGANQPQQLRLTVSQFNGNQTVPAIGVTALDIMPDAQGMARLAYFPERTGFYQFQLMDFNNKGYLAGKSETTVLIHNPAKSWVETPDGYLALKMDPLHYQPGDVAQLQILSSFGGTALLALERGTIRRLQQVTLTPPVTQVDLPLIAEDAPNLFVSAHIWTPTQQPPGANSWRSEPNHHLRSATVELAVTPINKQLTVSIRPEQTTYVPRTEAQVALIVTDEAGAPVQAELSLAVVDEALFELSEDLSEPLFPAFYHARAHGVQNYDMMAPSRVFGGGRGGGGNGFTPNNPRREFPDTALWLPVIRTDEEGQATVSFTMPDTLTRWRVMVKAVTTATQVAEATAVLTTTQPVSIQPLLPASLTVGDVGMISALLHNNTALTQTLAVNLATKVVTATGGVTNTGEIITGEITTLVISDATTQTVTVAPDASAVIGWNVEAVASGTAALLFHTIAANNDGDGNDDDSQTDAIQVTLPIQPRAIRNVTSEVGHFTKQLTTTLDYTHSITTPATLAQMGEFHLSLSRSLAGSMLEGLDYLTGYPYGCVEQTMSRALPNVVVGRAFYQLGIGDPTLQDELPEMINAGLQRLYGFQHSDGGWGWWYDDDSDAYQTAWVLFGLAITTEAGYEVDPSVIERGVGYLRNQLPGLDQQQQAFALYSMAHTTIGVPQTTLYRLVDELHTLDPFGQAALALSLIQIHGPSVDQARNRAQATTIVDALLEQVQQTEAGAYWPAAIDDGIYQQKFMVSAVRSTALVLSAITAIQPEHELIPDIVRWLMNQRQAQGWGTTNETAFTLLALTDHLLATEMSDNATPYRVLLNGQEIMTGTISPRKPSAEISIPAHQLVIGANQLAIETETGARLYYRLVQTSYSTVSSRPPTGPITVYREYIDPTTRMPITRMVVGQLVEVQLTVQIDQATSYMLVEDQLPSGLVALNERLNNEQRIIMGNETMAFQPSQQMASQQMASQELNLPYNRKEVHPERVTFFVTEMAPGNWRVIYLARATTSGHFVALPAEAYAMYDLAQWGRSQSQPLQVVK